MGMERSLQKQNVQFNFNKGPKMNSYDSSTITNGVTKDLLSEIKERHTKI